MARNSNRYFDFKGNEYDYDYFKHCFSTFPVLVKKVKAYLPFMEEDFIKHSIQVKILKPNGYMVRTDGKKIRLYYTILVLKALLLMDDSGRRFRKDRNGNYVMEPSAKKYYERWKYQQQKPDDEEAKHQAFIDNVSRYDPDIKKD